jgi:MoaA/NifB/PqqE/SkfB family radical SAM enzyme
VPEPLVSFKLTNRCQLDCLQCLVADGDRKSNLPVDLYEDILRQVSDYGIHRLSFTGGEPTLHPQFANILDIACRRGFIFSLVTNGWDFSKTLPVLRQYRRGLELITLSLDGAREETHDSMRRAGSYRRVLDAMDLCQKEGIVFDVQTVLTSRNYTEVEAMCDLVVEKGARLLSFMECAPTPRSARHGLDLSPEKYVELGTDLRKLAPKYRPRLIARSYLGAHSPTPWMVCQNLTPLVFSIDAEGRLWLCSNLAAYASCPPGSEMVADLKEVSFHEAQRRLIEISRRLLMDKVDAIEKGTVSVRDATLPCWYCNKYFDNTGWLKEFPDNPWNEWSGTNP